MLQNKVAVGAKHNGKPDLGNRRIPQRFFLLIESIPGPRGRLENFERKF